MNKTKYIESIRYNLSSLVDMVKTDGKSHRFSINSSAEDFAAEFLSILYDIDLRNLNADCQNVPAVDLEDKENRIVYQVSSTADKRKIKTTFETIVKHKLNDVYRDYTIRFLFLVNKAQVSVDEGIVCPDGMFFDSSSDIIDIETLTRESVKQNIKKLEKLSECANSYINVNADSGRGKINLMLDEKVKHFAYYDQFVTEELLSKATCQISRYIQREYEKNSRIHSFAAQSNEFLLKEIYQPLTLTPKCDKKSKETFVINEIPDNFISQCSKILIVDTAGMGKSTLSKRIFLNIVDKGIAIPVMVELRNIKKGNTLINEILNKILSSKEKLDEHIFYNLMEDGDFIFIFDGYDEIAFDEKEMATSQLLEFLNILGRNKCFLTSRDEDELSSFLGFKHYGIKPMTDEEAFELLSKFDKNGRRSRELISVLKQDRKAAASEYLKNPLLVSLLFAAYDYEPTLPTKKSDFYEQVFLAMFKKHDLTKGAYVHDKVTKLSYSDMYYLLRFIAFKSEIEEVVSYTESELLTLFQDAKDFTGLNSFNSDDLLKDVSVAVPLFIKEEKYRWAHKSLREFFAAQYIVIDAKKDQADILMGITEGKNFYRYSNLVELYSSIAPNNFRRIVTYNKFKKYIDFCKEHGVTANSTELEKKCVSLLYSARMVRVNQSYSSYNRSETDYIRFFPQEGYNFRRALIYKSKSDKDVVYIRYLNDDINNIRFRYRKYCDVCHAQSFPKWQFSQGDYYLVLSDLKKIDMADMEKIYSDVCGVVTFYFKYDKVYAEYKRIEKEIEKATNAEWLRF